MFTETESISTTSNNYVTYKHESILRRIVLLNVLILFLVIIKTSSPFAAFLGGVAIILYISFLAVSSPAICFYTIFGVKLTFDALWDVRLGSTGTDDDSKLLVLFFIPILILLITSVMGKNRVRHWGIVYLLFYLSLIILATICNDVSSNYAILSRQGSIIIGLVLGLLFIKKEEDLKLVIAALLMSTVVPVIATDIQFFVGNINIPIFHYTLETIREARQAGLYFDAATNGMVSIIALVSSLYVLQSARLRSAARILLFIFVGMILLAITSGSTRSILIITSFVLMFSFITNYRKLFFIMPLVVTIIYFMQPYMDQVILKTTSEIRVENIQYSELLTSSEYRGLLTGRMSIWQDIWSQFNSGSSLQQVFGSGLISNAHSSYFFLLLQIGWLGLFIYLLFHLMLLWTIYKSALPKKYKNFGILLLFSALMMGVSATVVTYTSFQLIIYFIIGSLMNMSITGYYEPK